MPVKVQCKGCEKVLTAPDKLRGKTVKCPKCKSPLKIPSGKKKRPATAGAAKKRRRPVEAEQDDYNQSGDDLFGGLDLRGAEDRKVKLCPKCATQVDPEDIECLNCGVNIATGVLSAKQRKSRARKGPDPEEYWGKLYKDSWKFTKNHWQLALKTAGMYLLLGALTACAARTCNWCYVGYRDMVVQEIKDSNGKIQLQKSGIIVNATNDAPVTFIAKRLTNKTQYPRPEIMAAIPLNNPPFIFWAFMTGVFGLALGGWMWWVGTNIIQVTLDGKKKVKHLQGDFFRLHFAGNQSRNVAFYFVVTHLLDCDCPGRHSLTNRRRDCWWRFSVGIASHFRCLHGPHVPDLRLQSVPAGSDAANHSQKSGRNCLLGHLGSDCQPWADRVSWSLRCVVTAIGI